MAARTQRLVPRRPSRRRAEVLAILGVVVHLVGAWGPYLHFALVEHERCAEHGELVHVAASPHLDGEGHERAIASGDGAHGEAVVAAGGEDARDSHDPCSLTLASRHRATQPEPGAVGQAPPPREGALLPSTDAPYSSGRDGYRVAPKTSPPLRA